MPPMQNLHVQSVWDGVEDHPAQVTINISIELEPGSSHVLLDLAGHSANTASVSCIRKLPNTPLPVKKRQRSEHQENSLITPNDQDALQNSNPRATNAVNNETDLDSTAPSAKRRLYPSPRSKTSDVCKIDLVDDDSTVGPKATDTLPLATPVSVHFSPFNERIRSISNTTIQTIQVHTMQDADDACQDSTNRYEAHKRGSGTSTPHLDLLSQDQHKTPGTKSVQKPKENKKPWQTPSQEDFLPAGRSVKTSSKHLSSIPAVPISFPATSLSTANVSTPRPSQASRGGSEAGTFSTKTRRSRSERASSSEKSISSTPTMPLDEDDQDRMIASPCDLRAPSLKLVGVKRGQRSSVSKSTRSSIPAPKTRPRAMDSPSPDVSPRIWLRRYGRFGSSSQWFLSRELTPVRLFDGPSWKIQNNKLEICFANCASRQTYALEIKASIRLCRPHDEDWLEFIVPGLPRPENSDFSGSVDFSIVPSGRQSSIGIATDEADDQSDEANIVEAQFDTMSLTKVRVGLARVCGRFWPQNSKLLRTRLKLPIYHIVSWNASISLHTAPTGSKAQGVQLRHHAILMMEEPKKDIFAVQAGFSFHVKQGPLLSREFTLDASHCSVYIDEDTDQRDRSTRNSIAKITVYRNTEDLGLPLDVYFMSSYAPKDGAAMALPTLYPTEGKVLSERILLTKPCTPLIVEHVERAFFSSWKKTEVTRGSYSIFRFDRVELPQLFPDGLKDDVIIRVRELCPVQFSALETLEDSSGPAKTSSPVWNLDVQIDRVCGQTLVCRMSLVVEVDDGCERLLTFDAHNWIPELSFIDGRLATHTAGEWRESEDGYLTLLKAPEMSIGQRVRVEMRWKELIVTGEPFKSEVLAASNVEYQVPTVIGKSILGGSLKCNDDNVMLSLFDGEAEGMAFRFFKSDAQNQTRLPKLSPGYNMRLSFDQMLRRSPRIVRFVDEFDHGSETSSNSSSTLGHNDTLSPSEDPCMVSERCHPPDFTSSNESTSSNEKGKPPPLWRLPMKLAGAGLQCLVIPFLLISVAQLLVAHVGHRLIPSSIENFFSAVRGSTAGPGSRANWGLGSLLPNPSDVESHLRKMTPSGGTKSSPAVFGATTGGLHQQRPGGQMQERVSALVAEQGLPLTETRSLIDWIDRALGWKEIRL